jgi:Condensation domain/TubC N-terminal docking domain
MMGSLEYQHLLISLRRRGLRISAGDGMLHVNGAKGLLTSKDLYELRNHKQEIIQLLNRIEVSRDLPVRARRAESPVPLTPMLDYCWNVLTKGNAPGVAPRSRRQCTFAMRIDGPLDIELLRECIQILAMRHETLRSVFGLVDGTPRQIVQSIPRALELVDYSGQPRKVVASLIDDLISTFANREIDLSQGPLFEPLLCRIGSGEHILILVLDHWITDGSSNVILCDDIWTLYEQGESRQPLRLADVPVQFGDYAVWLEETAEAWFDQHGTYWQDRLTGIQATALPLNNPSRAAESAPVWNCFEIDANLSASLAAFSRQRGTMLPLVLLAIFVLVMHRWCNRSKLLIGVIANGRDRPELSYVVGNIATALILCVRVEARWSFLELLEHVIGEYLAASEHYDFARVLKLHPGAATPICFNWLPTAHVWAVHPAKSHYGSVTLTSVYQRPSCQDAFFPYFSRTPTSIEISVVYRPDQVSAAAIERFGSSLIGTARAVSREPAVLLSSLPWQTLR